MQAQALKPASGTPASSDAELLDILYEILADDTGDDHGVSAGDIEAFLHEHARSPESAGSISAFFDRHGLSRSPADHGQDPALKSVPSGVHVGMLPVAPTGGPAAFAPELPELAHEPTPAPRRGAATPAASSARPTWLTPTLVVIALLLGLVGAVSAFAALEERALERELSLSRLQLRATGEAVDALRSEARALHQELDAQRANERQLREELTVLQEAERVRQQHEAEERERKARRWGGRPRRAQTAQAAVEASPTTP